MSEDRVLPQTVDALLDYLDQNYPEKSPDLSWPDRVVWAKVGERGLVNHLLELRRRRDESPLE